MSVSTENQVISTSSNSIHQPSLKIDLLDIAKRHYSQTPEFSDNPRFFKSKRRSHPIQENRFTNKEEIASAVSHFRELNAQRKLEYEERLLRLKKSEGIDSQNFFAKIQESRQETQKSIEFQKSLASQKSLTSQKSLIFQRSVLQNCQTEFLEPQLSTESTEQITVQQYFLKNRNNSSNGGPVKSELSEKSEPIGHH